MDDAATVKCPCGKPLHYRNKENQEFIEEMIAEMGETVAATTSAGTWKVPRHYIALHGLEAWKLPELAKQYNWEKVD